MEIIKIGMVGLIGVLFAMQFKMSKPEYSYLIIFGVCLLIFMTAMRYMESLMLQRDSLKTLFSDKLGYFKILLKVIGITYICEFCSGICGDAGYKAVANQIEIFGKVLILIAGMPILLSLIQVMQQFVEG